MLMAVDIGNTNIHVGLWQAGAWQHDWRARTVADKMPDEYAALLRILLDDVNIAFEDISGVVISSVVPPLTDGFAQLARRYLGVEPLIVTHQVRTGITVDIDQPEQAGADRIVNTAAVVALYGGPAIVIDFGTATTFDVVSSGSAYVGGAIAPGLRVAHDALVSRAARLHKVDLVPPPSAIGTNTIHAMQSGIFWGYVGLVEGLVARLKASLGQSESQTPITVYATGGLATLFDQHTDMIDVIVPRLTLDGLRIIYELNQ